MAAAAAGAPVSPDDQPGNPDARMTPAVRRLLREHGLTAAQFAGTGGGGRITREDVIDFVEAGRTGKPAGAQGQLALDRRRRSDRVGPGCGTGDRAGSAPAPIDFPAGADEVLVPMTQMRKGISAQMTSALQVPAAYVTIEVDMTSVVRLATVSQAATTRRRRASPDLRRVRGQGHGRGAQAPPDFNAHVHREGLLRQRPSTSGIAVAVDDGLVVPVINDADALSIHGLNRALPTSPTGRAATSSRSMTYKAARSRSITRAGRARSSRMPIINVPEVGILTMESIVKRAVVVETAAGDLIAIRPMMYMALGFDHRANDGAGGPPSCVRSRLAGGGRTRHRRLLARRAERSAGHARRRHRWSRVRRLAPLVRRLGRAATTSSRSSATRIAPAR